MGYKVISMFSGAGGLDMGFHNKGFNVLWANDFNEDACETYDLWANYDITGVRKHESDCTKIVCGDISKINPCDILPGVDVDVVLGGFPCQGFSLAGPRMVDDSRNILYRHFVEMVRIKKPKVMVAENVIGIKTLGNGAVFNKIIEDFSSLGYTMSAPSVNAKFFGVPQDRMRVIFIGIRNDISQGGAYIFPRGDLEIVTLQKALQDLGPVDMNDVCQASFSSRYMSRNRKRDYDDVSFTIPAMAKQVPLSPDSEGMEYIDVDRFDFIGTYNRRLSYKEAAAIQTFPRDMVFYGDLDSKYRQIGNAVPVKLAEAIASEVLKILSCDDLTPFLNLEKPENEIYEDRRITNTVINGKAFEYASLIETYSVLRRNGWEQSQLSIKKDKNLHNIQKAFELIHNINDDEPETDFEQSPILVDFVSTDYIKAARVAAQYLFLVEPILQSSDGLYALLSAMPDSAGSKGDVRDINISIYDNQNKSEPLKEIGISCKNNHEAVKHPRITDDPNFAFQWTGISCSDSFMNQMKDIQLKIDEYAKSYGKWSEVDDKMDTIYYPIVKAFVSEIKRLGIAPESASKARKAQAKIFTERFFEYMFGNQDFYKFIKDDNSASTKVYPYNIHGKLMNPYKGSKYRQAVQSITMPNEIVEVRIKPESKTTLEVYFDQWIISMRLHNADSTITKTSLKFDVQIKAQPRKIVTVVLPWDK